jgi:SAM-dependent methyltransferase
VSVAQAYAGDISSESERASVLGFIGGATGLGYVVGPVFGGILSTISMVAPFYAAIGLTVLTLLLTQLVLAETTRPENSGEETDAATPAFSSSRVLLIVAAFFSILGFSALQNIFPLFGVRVLFADPGGALTPSLGVGAMLTFVGLVIAVSQIFVIRPLARTVPLPLLVVGGNLLLMTGATVVYFTSAPLLVLAAFVPFGLGYAVSLTGMQTMMSRGGGASQQGASSAFSSRRSASGTSSVRRSRDLPLSPWGCVLPFSWPPVRSPLPPWWDPRCDLPQHNRRGTAMISLSSSLPTSRLSPNRRNHMKCCNRIQPAPGVAPEAISPPIRGGPAGRRGRNRRRHRWRALCPLRTARRRVAVPGDAREFVWMRRPRRDQRVAARPDRPRPWLRGGLDLVLAAARVGPSGTVIGVDLSDAMIERARSNARTAGWENIELRRGAIEALPVESASVDWVISNCVINLSPDKDLVFREIYRVLRPGGRVLVSDIVAESLPFWVRRSGLLTVACVAGAIPESDYLAGMAAAGLTDPEIRGRMHYSAGQMAEVVVESLPSWTVALFGWLVRPLLTWLATPVAGKLWSVRVAAYKDVAAYKNEGGEART